MTPSDWSMQNPMVSAYDLSLPTSVMSVPCSVVTTLRTFAAAGPGQDVLGQVGRGRVRDGVVRVNDVEIRRPRQLDDLRREREQVLRLAEQRVGRRGHPVERHARLVVAQPERLLAADDVNLVAARGEALGQLGGDDPAASDRRVADHGDLHGRALQSLKRCGRRTGSFTTSPSANATPDRAPNCASRLSMSCEKVGAFSLVATAPSPSARNWLR